MLLRCVLVLLAVASCVDRGSGPQGKKIEPSYVRDHVLTQVPAEVQRIDISLGGKVVYVGSRAISRDSGAPVTQVAPGGSVRVLHYWQVTQPLGPGWKIFRHARGGPGTADFMSFGPTDMELGLPTAKWKPGQIIEDVQDIVVRPDWRSPIINIYVGLVAEGGNQLGDRMLTTPATGPNVVDRAVIARVLEVDLSRAPPPPGTVHVPHATGEITIDGIASEPGWSSGVMSELVTADGSGEPVGKAVARMAWDERNLYVFVQVTDTDVYSQYKTHDEPIWKQDVVEIFIDADGNRRGYVELQVNPNNTTFDSYFASTRAQPGDESWSSNMQTAVRVRGTADKAGDADQGWDVEIAIPLEAVKGRDNAMNVRLPPQVGDKWRLNVVRVDYRSNGGSPGVSSWNRIGMGDFHALDRMLTVIFADPSGSIVAKPADATAPGQGSGSAAPGQGSASAPAPATGSATPTIAPVHGKAAAPATGSATPRVAPAPSGTEPSGPSDQSTQEAKRPKPEN